jgi:tRNA 2-selenouridine synthase
VARGAIPGAPTLPILEDDERHAVGLRYAEEGQAAATREGELRTRDDMARRAAAWRAAASERPSAFFCWRGGLRSELAQRLAGDPATPRIEGGYKALRAHLVGSLPGSLARRVPLVVSGSTGCGKTELLATAAELPTILALDLEGAAEHRGSAFGATGPQPAQATFEHRLAIPLLLGCEPWLLLENESRNVGRVHLPAPLYEVVACAPRIVLEASLDERLRRIHRDYADVPARRRGVEPVLAELQEAVRRLRRRLGAEATERMIEVLSEVRRQGAWHDPEAFRPVIEPLLRDYYDPAYRKATPEQGRPVLARGDREELLEWLTTLAAGSPA